MAAEPTRRLFTVKEYYRMLDAGILRENIADLLGEAIRGHREPTPDGYRITFLRRRGERISLAAFPDIDFAIEDLLG